METIYQVKGIVIRKQPFKESGYLVDLLTDQLGMIKLLVRSRRQRSISAALELFNHGNWYLKEGRTFYFFHDYEPIQSFRLQGRLIWSGYYLNELLIRLNPHNQPDQWLFNCYLDALNVLVTDQISEISLRYFEEALLNALGILPDFSVDHLGAEVKASATYYLTVDNGLSAVNVTQSLAVEGSLLIKIMNRSLLNRKETQKYKGMMRFLLQPCLGNRPLQSRLWLQKLYYS